MVLAEIPLWVSHGNPLAADSNGTRTLPGMMGPSSSTTTTTATAANAANNSSSQQNSNANKTSRQSLDAAAAKSALSLLSSTRGSGRAPMYSIDVHPDGTRFATAAGDGTVKIWGLGCLFAGKLTLRHDNDGDERGSTKKKKKKGKRVGKASSKFDRGGNYVSSNSEDYESSSSDEPINGQNNGQPSSLSMMQQQQQMKMPPGSPPQAGSINDLSGLVRKKKGGNMVSSSAAFAISTHAASAKEVNPLSAASSNAADASLNKEGPIMSPLSRWTAQRPGGSENAASASTSASAANYSTGNHTFNSNNNTNNTNYYSTSSTSNNNKKHNKKLLSTISSHEGSVLSLRFSPSGTYLATAGDDSYVNIYVRSATPSLAKGNLVGVGADGTGGTKHGEPSSDIEHWNRIAICRGHHLDVVGLAWAPDDSHLVSCSLDSHNPIIVWRLYNVLSGGDTNDDGGRMGDGGPGGGFGGGMGAGGGGMSAMGGGMSSSVHIHNLHPFKILGRHIHTSTVKGVSFDPAGKYLATSGDDPAICIWRAFDDWGLEARVDSGSGVFRSKKRKCTNTAAANTEEGMEDDPGELTSLSLFRRISFAPDGSHVCGTNATLRGKNIAAMISREGWMASGPGGGAKKDGGGKKSAAVGAAEGRVPTPARGAANLVGHKQPVVASRHCPIFFAVPKKKKKPSSSSDNKSKSNGSSSSGGSESSEESDDPDAEPEYATLVALGDKRGFVTVWSTKNSRPLFKMQCSESRCTVTDISWGLVRHGSNSKNGSHGDDDNGEGDSLVMLVSLLDGYIVALHFSIPTEVGGSILPSSQTRRIFQLKYGIDDFVDSYCFSPGKKSRAKKRLVDDAGPMLIENALQLRMEMEAEAAQNQGGGENENGEEESGKDGADGGDKGHAKQPPLGEDGAPAAAAEGNIKDKQVETSTKGGKKRIRPVLMNAAGGAAGTVTTDEDVTLAQAAAVKEAIKKKRQKKSKDAAQPADVLQNVLDAASQAALAAEGVTTLAANRVGVGGASGASGSQSNRAAQANARSSATTANMARHSITNLGPSVRIPYHTNKILSVNLTSKSTTMLLSPLDDNVTNIVADCTNSTSSSGTSSLSSWPSTTLTISSGGVRKWKDILFKSQATALAANHALLAVGTSDGCLYLFGTSPTCGWDSCMAYRAFPPFVLGSPVVDISISGIETEEMVVVTSDGNFYVFTLSSKGPKLNYKGSVVPAMQHMYLQSSQQHRPASLQPKIARIQITDSKQLMLILVQPIKSTGSGSRSLQGFVYNRNMELWMRISDSNNFILSDFYSSPSASPAGGFVSANNQVVEGGILAKMDKYTKSNASSMASAKQMYQKVASSENNNAAATGRTTSQNIVTRSHCEDRLACSLVLGSSSEFQMWMRRYAQCLVATGDGDALRFLVDILLGSSDDSTADAGIDGGEGSSPQQQPSSFLSLGKSTLNLDGKDLVRKAILPEMSKNRLLQRLTNEISMEIECL